VSDAANDGTSDSSPNVEFSGEGDDRRELLLAGHQVKVDAEEECIPYACVLFLGIYSHFLHVPIPQERGKGSGTR
jgi:hypothetical protein